MIQLRNISLGFGSRSLLASGNASFADGTLTALIGRNGSGKSTLLRAMAGLDKPRGGHVLIDNEALSALSASQRARALAFVGTARIRVANLTCRQAVAMGRAPYTGWAGALSPADRQAVDRALETVGMLHMQDRTLDTLSDGERQRVMTARAVAQDTPNILLDEPTSFLDLPSRHAHVRLLHTLADGGKCIVFSTHELDLALRYAHTLAIVDDTARTLIILPADSPSVPSTLTRIFGPLA